MRIIRFMDRYQNVLTGEPKGDNTAVILEGSIEEGFRRTEKSEEVVKLLPPVLPPNIFAVGFNYVEHADEARGELLEYPIIFMKATSAIAAHGDDILLPKCEMRGPETDFEGELAVVIGKRVKNVSTQEAEKAVLGYACANDVSARRWQKHAGGGQWIRAKSFDTFCPLGPQIVTKDETGEPQNLEIETSLNGEIMQRSNTSKMIFKVAEIISYISEDTTLLPGTVILTGTPEGVGFARTPMVFLKTGDEVSVEIEKVGKLVNSVSSSLKRP